MPTYEYACPKCNFRFEKFQSMRDEPLKKCPKCGRTGVKRLIGGGGGLIFKGAGFYANDYRKSPSKSEGGEGGGSAGAKPAAPVDGGKPASGESKPASSESKSASGDSKPASSGSS